MKSFQADTMQEALALVKDEMGPDAVILKSRRTTRKVGLKMQHCFEVTAALDESLFARPATTPQPQREVPAARAFSPAGRVPDPSRAPIPQRRAPTAPATPIAPAQYDWRGSLRRVDEEGNALADSASSASAAPAAPLKGSPEAAAAAIQKARGLPASNDRRAFQQDPKGPDRRSPVNTPEAREDADVSLVELLRSELKEMKANAGQPVQAMKDLKDEIKAMMESAAARTAAAASHAASHTASHLSPHAASRQMEAKSFPRSAVSPTTAWIPNPEFQALQEALTEMEVEPALAAEAVGAAYAEFRMAFKQEVPAETAGIEPGERETALLARNLAERIRVTGGIRLRPGRPTTVALVGPTGVGKTTSLAKLAALAKIQQGKKVGIISADSFRMGANEQLELFGRTAGIAVKPVFSPADVAQAQREFSDCDLILVDTAGRSHTHKEMWRELQGLLHCLAPDEIHLVLSGPTRMRELWHQYGLYRDLGAGSIIFTKLDECLSLGCLYNLARRAEAPLSYLCNGQVIPDHIMLARTDTVASAIAEAARGSLASSRVAH
jgi:flagellar biosynthesis protein FlhF